MTTTYLTRWSLGRWDRRPFRRRNRRHICRLLRWVGRRRACWNLWRISRRRL